jgi:hypothetical protein
VALSKDEVIKMAKAFLESIPQRHDVWGAYLFGSSTTGIAKDLSGVGLAVASGSPEKFKNSPCD